MGGAVERPAANRFRDSTHGILVDSNDVEARRMNYTKKTSPSALTAKGEGNGGGKILYRLRPSPPSSPLAGDSTQRESATATMWG